MLAKGTDPTEIFALSSNLIALQTSSPVSIFCGKPGSALRQSFLQEKESRIQICP
jgi:hypothetical protein